jgi:hypothetical protein
MQEITYELIVSVDGETVYDSEFLSEESLIGDGLRKADHAIQAHADEEEE